VFAFLLCRDEKLLESKRPVIPDGGGAQTSFRDQLKGLDGLDLGLLLYENPQELKPKVLLSHSGTMATLPVNNSVKRFDCCILVQSYVWSESVNIRGIYRRGHLK